jgi:hypothetical protein
MMFEAKPQRALSGRRRGREAFSQSRLHFCGRAWNSIFLYNVSNMTEEISIQDLRAKYDETRSQVEQLGRFL